MKKIIPKYTFREYWYKPVTERTLENRKLKLEKRTRKGKYPNHEQLLHARNAFYKTSLKRRATREEIIVGDWLWNHKIYFNFQKGFFTPFHRIADFYIPFRKLIVEIDGGYHQDIKIRDNYKDKVWKLERGMVTLRIANEQVHSGEFVSLLTAHVLGTHNAALYT